MAAKPLPSKEYLRICFDYDRETGVLRWKNRPREHFSDEANFIRWQKYMAGRVAGVIRKKGVYRQINMGGRSIMSHRIIWKMETGEEPLTIDHKNTMKSDNRWENLRPATAAQNSQNRRGKVKRNGGTLKGANWNKADRVWRASIRANGTTLYLGRFSTEADAHARYREEAARLHGEFANLEGSDSVTSDQ